MESAIQGPQLSITIYMAGCNSGILGALRGHFCGRGPFASSAITTRHVPVRIRLISSAIHPTIQQTYKKKNRNIQWHLVCDEQCDTWFRHAIFLILYLCLDIREMTGSQLFTKKKKSNKRDDQSKDWQESEGWTERKVKAGGLTHKHWLKGYVCQFLPQYIYTRCVSLSVCARHGPRIPMHDNHPAPDRVDNKKQGSMRWPHQNCCSNPSCQLLCLSLTCGVWNVSWWSPHPGGVGASQ